MKRRRIYLILVVGSQTQQDVAVLLKQLAAMAKPRSHSQGATEPSCN